MINCRCSGFQPPAFGGSPGGPCGPGLLNLPWVEVGVVWGDMNHLSDSPDVRPGSGLPAGRAFPAPRDEQRSPGRTRTRTQRRGHPAGDQGPPKPAVEAMTSALLVPIRHGLTDARKPLMSPWRHSSRSTQTGRGNELCGVEELHLCTITPQLQPQSPKPAMTVLPQHVYKGFIAVLTSR